MIKILIKKFIEDYTQTTDKKVRERYSILAGSLGVVCNIFLFGLKILIGWSVNSVAIISDAFNNFSDTGSSLVTVIGAKLSNKQADREHPYGHGRMEYVSSLIVSFIIIIVGVEMVQSSFGKIFSPTPVSISPVMLVVLVSSLVVKLWMYSYNKYMGMAIDSTILRATATDSINDVFATSAVIISAYVGQFFPSVPVDGIIGVLVSLLIIKAGFGIAQETVNTLLGSSPDSELVEKLEGEIMKADGIVGVHDLLVHDYGPGRVIASVHAEVRDDADIVKVHEVIDYTEKRIGKEMGIELVIHMDPISVDCEVTNSAKNMVVEFAEEINPRFSIHDFRMTDGEQNVNLIFDVVMPCEMSEQERQQAVERLTCRIKDNDPKYSVVVNVDIDYK